MWWSLGKKKRKEEAVTYIVQARENAAQRTVSIINVYSNICELFYFIY